MGGGVGGDGEEEVTGLAAEVGGVVGLASARCDGAEGDENLPQDAGGAEAFGSGAGLGEGGARLVEAVGLHEGAAFQIVCVGADVAEVQTRQIVYEFVGDLQGPRIVALRQSDSKRCQKDGRLDEGKKCGEICARRAQPSLR